MRLRNLSTLAIAVALVIAVPLQAQRLVDVTVDILDRLLRAHTTEQAEMGKVDPQLKAVDDKIQKFRDCKTAFEAAGSATGSAAGGLAARLAMRAKCGASSEDDIQKEKEKILEGPQNAAAKAGNFKVGDYVSLRDKVMAFLHGDRSGFTPGALTLLAQRESDLSSNFGIAVASAPASSGSVSSSARSGARMPGMWSQDYAWQYIGQMFAMQYMSGATMFEKPYAPGDWTKWQMVEADNPDEQSTMERAFLGTTAEGSQWWRLKTLTSYKDNDVTKTDTVVLEALFKPMSESVQQLVRVRGKLPGNAEPQELIVPQAMSMISMNGMFPFKPTPESVDGATVGTENLTNAAGTFAAKHVRFGGGDGTLDWWLADNAPGGWVKFAAIGGDKKETYRMEMVGQGKGATSELGIRM